MRIKVYRKSTPYMDPLIIGPFKSQEGVEETVQSLGTGKNVRVFSEGVDTVVMASDVSYIQVVE